MEHLPSNRFSGRASTDRAEARWANRWCEECQNHIDDCICRTMCAVCGRWIGDDEECETCRKEQEND